VATLTGPAVVREFRIQPQLEESAKASARQDLLRDLLIDVRWDDHPNPSILAPLGDFVGSMWRRVQFQSRYLGGDSGGLWNRLPMPFARRADFALTNQGEVEHTLTVSVMTRHLESWDGSFGLLHAVFRHEFSLRP